MGARSVFVYALCDVVRKEIFYIGRTNNPDERLSFHLRDGCLAGEDEHHPRILYIKKMLAEGRAPVMIILEHVRPTKAWPERERHWIQVARSLQWPITNQSEGGEGHGYNNESGRRQRRSNTGAPRRAGSSKNTPNRGASERR